MKRCLRITILFASICLMFQSQAQTFNYDEAKVGDYVLPDLLVDGNGKRIVSKEQWLNKRRPQILNLFKAHVYGNFPKGTEGIRFKVTSIDTNALGGKATRKEITIFFTASTDSPWMDVLLYLPNHVHKPAPVFIGLNFYGNHTTQYDPEIKLSERWMRENKAYQIKDHKATEASRGVQSSRWPVDSLIAHGYGVATAYYGDLEPDHADGWKIGIRTTLQHELKIKPEAWGAIGAWGWGLCRILDYLEMDVKVNAKEVVVTGHSRLGKAALWAAANDERFAMIISNCSGEGGTALARRNFGETIARINTSYPYWFGAQYKQYNNNVNALPVDQHMLLALMAPRPLYVSSAEGDRWADPKGEFLSLVNASPVYALFNKKGIESTDKPELNNPIHCDVAYKIRPGKHDITQDDWKAFILFSDIQFKEKNKETYLEERAAVKNSSH